MIPEFHFDSRVSLFQVSLFQVTHFQVSHLFVELFHLFY